MMRRRTTAAFANRARVAFKSTPVRMASTRKHRMMNAARRSGSMSSHVITSAAVNNVLLNMALAFVVNAVSSPVMVRNRIGPAISDTSTLTKTTRPKSAAMARSMTLENDHVDACREAYRKTAAVPVSLDEPGNAVAVK
jgi:hypothetical protein